ncbi:MAG: UvrD-helicase domain-containing protein [Oceanospirillaceae bacterium]
MHKHSYQSSWPAKIFSQSNTQITLSETGIELYPQKLGPTLLLWSEISPPVLISGTFFDQIIITSSQQKFAIRWLSKNNAASLYAKSSQQLYRYQSTLAANILSEISSKLAVTGYLRTSHCIAISEFAHQALAKIHIPPTNVKLPEDVVIIFENLLDWAHTDSQLISAIRETYVNEQKSRYKALFDAIESNPLTEKQRNACIVDEDNNLVLAGAGTGKTSTMIGRAAYLIASGQASDNQLLMLAYGREAAIEMRQRLKEKLAGTCVMASTFHSLGQQIIIHVEKTKPSVSPLAQDQKLLVNHIDHWFTQLLEQPEYKKTTLHYFEKYLYPNKNAFDFKSEGEYFEYLRSNEIRTLKGEAVKSYEECLIANWLFTKGIEYQYEATFQEKDTRSPDFRVYKPDFYLPATGIYIEHFGIDRHGNTASYVDREIYQQGMQWKRALHTQLNTTLVESYHYEQKESTLLTNLEKNLQALGVELTPLPDDALLATLKEFGAITAFSDLLGKLLQRYKAGNFDSATLKGKISNANNPGQLAAAIELLLPLVDRYEAQLKLNDEIDFADMLALATSYVEQGLFQSPWSYLLIDEFQDISEPRARLVKALRDSKTATSIFCVGDDWQAIYRFTGSDVALTTSFEQHFGATQTTSLDKTFRFNNSICDIASRFVMQNPAQVKKRITAHDVVTQPAVSIVRRHLENDDQFRALHDILQSISQMAISPTDMSTTKQSSTVYLLARYRFLLPDSVALNRINSHFPTLNIQTFTLHASKGKEADYVILLGLDNGKHGFPSRRVTHPLLEALLPLAEPYKHAEERRLLYVGLTRAKHRAYLLCDMSKASKFVTELISENYAVELNEFATSKSQAAVSEINCPSCDSGTLVTRQNNQNTFIGCTHYPLCKHIESACSTCDQSMKRQGSFRVCVDELCKTWVPICSSCDGDLKLRTSQYGRFWGCVNYSSEGISCTNKEKFIEPPIAIKPATVALPTMDQ